MPSVRSADLGIPDASYPAGWFHKPASGFEWRSDLEPVIDVTAHEWGLPSRRTTWGPWLVPKDIDGGWDRFRPPAGRSLINKFSLLPPRPVDAPDPGGWSGASPTGRAILEFANRYGWLSAPTLLKTANGRGRQVLGESYSLWCEEIAVLRDWAEVAGAARQVLEGGRIEDAYDALFSHFLDIDGRVVFRYGEIELDTLWVSQARREGYVRLIDREPQSLARYARLCIQLAIESRRPHIQLAYAYRDPRSQPPRSVPGDMRASLYLALDSSLQATPARKQCQFPGCIVTFVPIQSGQRERKWCGNTHKQAAHRLAHPAPRPAPRLTP